MGYYIRFNTTAKVDVTDMYQFMQAQLGPVIGEERQDGYYFYVMGQSARGVDFYPEGTGYEVRLVVLSSIADTQIATTIVKYFKLVCRDTRYFINEEPWLNGNPNEIPYPEFAEDAQMIKALIEEDANVLTFFGPKEQFYIGPWVLSQLHVNQTGWEQRLHELILKVLYGLPNYTPTNVMEMGDDTDTQLVKLVAPGFDYILKKYDYLIFLTSPETTDLDSMLFVTTETLLAHLPNTWTRVDEYTVIAPKLSTEAYSTLVQNLWPYDCKDELKK